jgi:hypothetical protein
LIPSLRIRKSAQQRERSRNASCRAEQRIKFGANLEQMNDARRKTHKSILSTMFDNVAELESLRDEEQEYFDNMPEGIQNSEKGEKAQEVIDALSTLIDGLEEGLNSVEDAVQS